MVFNALECPCKVEYVQQIRDFQMEIIVKIVETKLLTKAYI